MQLVEGLIRTSRTAKLHTLSGMRLPKSATRGSYSTKHRMDRMIAFLSKEPTGTQHINCRFAWMPSNNLNKLLGTPQYPEDAWVIDACRRGTTLFLDIVKTPEKTFPEGVI
eukprot:359252-Chlamydomonas_euryale.AAC.5